MPKTTVEFEFSLTDKVLIKEIRRPGVVMAVRIDAFAHMFLIAYWNDGNRKEEWLYAFELESRGTQ